jgi:ATP-dependent RNA helicase RhlE
MAKGVDVLVACPGRLLDLINQKSVDLSEVEIFVLDEADRMLDMGFIRDVKKVMSRLPARRQNLLYSATFSQDIIKLAGKLLNSPERVEVTPPNTTVERIAQAVYHVPSANHKKYLLAHLIQAGRWEQALVFTRTKHGANTLAEFLVKQGIESVAYHGNKSQNARTKTLADFKAGSVQVMVATDIAARGLDVKLLPHVVNYDLPFVAEDYVHRIGRTGRAGRSGEAVSLVSPEEIKLLRSIQRMTKQIIPERTSMGFDFSSVPTVESKKNDHPVPERRGGRRGGGSAPTKAPKAPPTSASAAAVSARAAAKNRKAKAPPAAPKGSARDAVRKRTTTATAKTKRNGAAGRRRSFSTLRTSLASGDTALGPVVSGAIGGDFRRPDTLPLSNSGGVTWTGAMDWALPVRCGSRLVDAVQRYRSNPWTSVDQTVARSLWTLPLKQRESAVTRPVLRSWHLAKKILR